MKFATVLIYCVLFGLLAMPAFSMDDSLTHFPIGDSDETGHLTNQQSENFKFRLTTFGVYYPKENDVNVGFGIGKANRDLKAVQWTLDFAPHHIGLGAHMTPGKQSIIGVGLNYTYNTNTRGFEPGLTLVLRR